MEKFKFEVSSFRKLSSPNGEDNIIKYVMYVKTSTIDEDIKEWFDTNPRYQNTDQNVSKGIMTSLKKNPEFFYNLNKGILFSAESVKFDNNLNFAEMIFSDKEIHGNIDGGHTLRIILKNNEDNKKLKHDPSDAYVFVEIITGIENRDEIVELAAARNKTVQVDQKSIADLERKFQAIKDLFTNNKISFKDRIIYKMNEEKFDNEKNIDIREIIAIMNMFNLDIYSNDIKSNPPIQSYTGKEVTLKKYLDLPDIEKSVNKFSNIIEEIFELYDLIETQFPEAFNKNNKKYGVKKYAKVKKNGESKFFKNKLEYSVPTGIIYPILGAFRALIRENKETGKFEWCSPPISIWNEEKEALAGFIVNDKTVDDPQQVGKNKNIWDMTFQRLLLKQFLDKKSNRN